MKKMLFVLLLILSQSTFANLAQLDSEKYNIHHVVMLKNAYIDFFIELEKNGINDKAQVFQMYSLLNSAYASSGKCFFAGWPSVLENNICKAPWTHGNKNWGYTETCGSSGDHCSKLVNTDYKSCGSPTKFRCSPLLFGKTKNGEGKCIDTGGTYYGLSQKCVDDPDIKANSGEHAKFLKQNPNILKKMHSEVSEFCKLYEKREESYDHKKTCKALNERLEYINKVADQDEKVTKAEVKERSRIANDALGFLQKCQEKYEKDNESWWDPESKRNTISYIVGSARCEFEDPIISNQEFQSLYESIEDIDEKVVPKTMLTNSLNDGLELSFKTYAVSKYQLSSIDITGGEETITSSNSEELAGIVSEFLENYPSLKGDSDAVKALSESAKDIENAFKAKKLNKVSPDVMMKNINDFASEMRKLCNDINIEFTNRTRLSEGEENYIDRSSDYNPMNTQSEKDYYQEVAQRQLNEAYAKFQKNDSKTQYGRLFSTEYFRDNIFPFNGNLGKKCARGDIRNDIFVDVNQEDLQKGMASFNEMMNKDFENLAGMYENSKSEDNEDIEESLEELIKYKPYLIGQFLKEQGNDPDTQMQYAKYLCKQNLDIYSSDEWFRVGEATVGAASLAVAGALAFTGVGTPISAALASASTGLMLGTGVMGIHKYDQGDLIENSAALRMTTSSSSKDYKTSVDDYSKLTDTARQLQNEGLVDIATAGVIPAAKMVRVGRNVINKSDEGAELIVKTNKLPEVLDAPPQVKRPTNVREPINIIEQSIEESHSLLKQKVSFAKLPTELMSKLPKNIEKLKQVEAKKILQELLGIKRPLNKSDKLKIKKFLELNKFNTKEIPFDIAKVEIDLLKVIFKKAFPLVPKK